MKNLSRFGISVGIATGAETAGRMANVAITLLVIAMAGATGLTDRFFFILAVAFYFFGVLANAVTQASVPLIISRTLLLKPAFIAACGAATGMGAILAALLVNWWITPVHAGYIAALGLLCGAGIANGLAAGIWQARERFVFPGLSWSLRLIPLAAWALLDGTGRSLPWLALGIGLADLGRCAVMLAGRRPTRDALPAASPTPLQALAGAYGTVILAAAISGLNPIIDRLIANLGSTGAISILETGERIYMMLASLATIGLATALLPRLSRDVAARTLVRNWPSVIKFVCVWGAAWLLAGWLLGRFGVDWWLNKGTDLSAAAAAGAQQVYWAYLLGLPFFALGLVYIKRLQALQRWRVLVAAAGISVALNIPASLVLFRLMGVPGIALATTLIYVLNCGLLLYAARDGNPPVPVSS